MSEPSLARRITDLEERLLSDEPFGPSTDVPFAIFLYEPSSELELRKEVDLLSTRLRNAGRQVGVVDLGAVMWTCLRQHPGGPSALMEMEENGTPLEDLLGDARPLLIGNVQGQPGPLEQRVIEQLRELDETDGIGLLVRAAELFPMYRTSALLERMIGEIDVRTVLFYPGHRRGATELSFMGICEPGPGYRPKVFAP